MTDYRIEQIGIGEFDVEPESVDLILTDPPYPREFLWTWRELAAFSERVLRPGGSLLAMCGHMFIDEIFAMFAETTLGWRWMIAHGLTSNARVYPRRVYSAWKPILWYAKGDPTAPRQMVRDDVRGQGRDKRFHEWGQDLGTFDHLTRLFSMRGELVCDPFLGGGTTALAALANGRRFLGCDVDAEAIRLTQLRIDAVNDYRRARLTTSTLTDTPGSLDDHEGVDRPEEEQDEQAEDQRPSGSGRRAARDGRTRPGQGGLRGGGEAGEARRADSERDCRLDDVPEGEEGPDVPDRRARRRRVDRRDAGGDGAGAGRGSRRVESGGDAGNGRREGRGEAGPEADTDREEADAQAEGRRDRLTAPSSETPEAAAPPASSLKGET